jgi:FlaA1/EpsC-like NDP-sugar epimerase
MVKFGQIKLRWRSRWSAFIFDAICIPIAWMGAYWLRFNLGHIPHDILMESTKFLPLVFSVQVVAFYLFGLYRGVWRFASLPDLSRIIKSILVGGFVLISVLFLSTRLENIPRSVFPIYSMGLLILLGGARFGFRWLKDNKGLFQETEEKVIIVGAGTAGEAIARDLLRTFPALRPVVFIDDDPKKIGRDIHGIPVVGGLERIEKIAKKYKIDRILVAIPSANAAKMRRIISFCEVTKRPIQTLPSVGDLLNGKLSVQSLREISLEDLLGRDPILLEKGLIEQEIRNKIICVTGGAGSIGSELCRQILKFQPKKIIILDHSEYNIFQLQREFDRSFPNKIADIVFYLADITDNNELDYLFIKYKPEVVFHAAAYKHVPILEPQIRSAIKNNILGTYRLAEKAKSYGVEKFVLVSTDKAVNPSNIMGASKRIAEMVCQHFNAQGKTKYITVRFGNVLGSRGSVVEIFKQQLLQGGPITVTHPDVTRYFMTISEAAQLILQAFSQGVGGELFVLDMGESVNITYLAEQIIRLAGKKPIEEIDIVYSGLRPGEKLHEELFHDEESSLPTQNSKIMQAKARALSPDFSSQIIDLFDSLALSKTDDLTESLLSFLEDGAKNMNRVALL